MCGNEINFTASGVSGISDVPLHFDDGENGMCNGYLLGPDGKPLVRRQGLTAAQIMSGKLASVLGLRVNDDTVSPAYIVNRHKITGYVGTVDIGLQLLLESLTGIASVKATHDPP